MLAPFPSVFAAASLAAHYVSALCAASPPRGRGGVPGPVSLIIPLCGAEPHSFETLRAALRLDGEYEVIFCVAQSDDPVITLVREAVRDAQGAPAQLLIGDLGAYANPKLRNMVRGYAAARHAWICFVDSNVLLPRDHIERLFDAWEEGSTGAVTAPAFGSRPRGFGANLECAFLNTYQARWQYAADAVGFGFAQGKCLFSRRDIIERGGGIATLASEPAEDAALTKLVRGLGLKVHLADRASEQPLDERAVREVWRRQVRWARLRRTTFPAAFLPEILTSALLPIVAAGADGGPMAALLVATLWYLVEVALAFENHWPFGAWALPALLARDALLPVLWCAAWAGAGFEWRGTSMTAEKRGSRALNINRKDGL
jgi:ceramide glucosyltransferase